MQIKKDQRAAVAVSRAHAKNTPLPISDDDMFCFSKSDNIYTYSVVMLMRKNYHLMFKIDDLIRRITESGLLTKWQKESEKIRRLTHNDKGDSSIILKIEHVEGAFLLTLIGLACAAIAFLLEWITYWLGKRYKNGIVQRVESFLCFTH